MQVLSKLIKAVSGHDLLLHTCRQLQGFHLWTRTVKFRKLVIYREHVRAKEHLYFLVVCIAPLWIRFPADTLIFILICFFNNHVKQFVAHKIIAGKNLSSVFSCLQQLTVVIPPHSCKASFWSITSVCNSSNKPRFTCKQ